MGFLDNYRNNLIYQCDALRSSEAGENSSCVDRLAIVKCSTSPGLEFQLITVVVFEHDVLSKSIEGILTAIKCTNVRIAKEPTCT